MALEFRIEPKAGSTVGWDGFFPPPAQMEVSGGASPTNSRQPTGIKEEKKRRFSLKKLQRLQIRLPNTKTGLKSGRYLRRPGNGREAAEKDAGPWFGLTRPLPCTVFR
jgi:hypothetical protein